MKTASRSILLVLCIFAATSAYSAGNTPALDVTVSKADGKLAYKSKLGANGAFATGKLEPGEYVVQFSAKSSAGLKGTKFAIVASAGKKKVTAEGVDGEKFATGGVAMKVGVATGMNITGQVANGQLAAAGGARNEAKTKMIHGKKYVWIGPQTGSNLGGRWVEEGSPEALNSLRDGGGQEGLRQMQDRGGDIRAGGN